MYDLFKYLQPHCPLPIFLQSMLFFYMVFISTGLYNGSYKLATSSYFNFAA